MKKICRFYLNLDKKYNKLEMVANWFTILLPIGLMTLMMIYVANTQGLTKEQLEHSTTGIIIGLSMILWLIACVWTIVYKMFKGIKRRKGNKELNKDNS